MYIVTINNPYYPQVEYFEDIKEATEQINEWKEDHQTEDGKKEAQITLAKVILSIPIIADY